jgi:hypothetical protein
MITINGKEIMLGRYCKSCDEGLLDTWVQDVKYTSRRVGASSNLGFGTMVDQIHRVTVDIPMRYVRPDGTINLGFKALFSDTVNEAAGFDNVELYASCNQLGLAPTSAPTTAQQKRVITNLTNNFIPGVSGDPHIKGACDLQRPVAISIVFLSNLRSYRLG